MSALTLFLNTKSGSVKPDETPDHIRDLLQKAGASVRIVEWATEGADKKVDEAVERGDTIVAGGGDGTIAGVAAHVVGKPNSFGVLPLGTLNHFAKDLGIPLELDKAVANLTSGRTQKVDTAKVNDLTFLNNSSLGIYPKLVRYREALQGKGYSKWIAFVKASAYILTHYSRMTIEFELKGKRVVRRTPLAFVGNNIYTLKGLSVGERKILNGGKLLLAITKANRPWIFMRNAIKAVLGMEIKDGFELTEATKLRITTGHHQVHVSADGEVHTLTMPLEYQIFPQSLNVIVPRA